MSSDKREIIEVDPERRFCNYALDIQDLDPAIRNLSEDQLFQIALTSISNKYLVSRDSVRRIEYFINPIVFEFEKLKMFKKRLTEYYESK